MRWLLLKDLQILRRSPLLLALLVLYPVAISLLIGFALSRGPEKPKVAFLNQVPPGQGTFDLGSERIDAASYASELFKSIQPVRVQTRQQAIDKVRSGEVLGALIIPSDVIQKLESGIQSASVEVIYNNEDPLKGTFVDSLINSRLADANAALSRKFRRIAAQDIGLLVSGGDFNVLGRTLHILGLRATRTILRSAQSRLPRRSARRAELQQVIDFANLAIDNFQLSTKVLGTVSQPVKVKRSPLQGAHRQSLSGFATAASVTVSLMFVTVLMAAGMLALEREEGAFARLVRGLVTRLGLLVEKIGLAALCAFLVALAMLAGIGAFIGLDYGRFPAWLAALAGGAIAFAALGVAIGGVTREVRAASLLAFLLSLPIAFLALVPNGAVSPALFDVIRTVSFVFPFKAALQATNSAINGGGAGLLGPLGHLLGLTLAFAALARVSLRRFA